MSVLTTQDDELLGFGENANLVNFAASKLVCLEQLWRSMLVLAALDGLGRGVESVHSDTSIDAAGVQATVCLVEGSDAGADTWKQRGEGVRPRHAARE